MDFLFERQAYDLFQQKIQQRIDKLNKSQKASISEVMQRKIHQSQITVENISCLALGFAAVLVSLCWFSLKWRSNVFR